MAHLQYMPGDPRLVDQLVYELKSKGIFDQFRKDCISDVDTRPAYQNLRQRVENSVSTFLARQCWKPDLNKNQLREKLRKHILDGNYLEQGVERIVDQVVNPKVATVFIPQVEDLVYNYLGIARKKAPETAEPGLLPTDLEAVSPGSVKSDRNEEDMVVDEPNTSQDDKMDVETESSDLQITETITSDDLSIDKCNIPLPAEEIRLENIPAPENSPPKVTEVTLDRIELPKEQNPSTDIPLPEESVKIEKGQYFRPLTLHSDDSNTSSDSSLRRNMSPLTPIRNFNNENSCDAQQGFDDSDTKSNDKAPSSFRFAIESDVKTDNKSDKKDDLSYQFNNQVNINYNTPMYDDSSNSNNLQIDYESDVSKNIEIKAEETSQDKKDKKDDKKSHKSSHRSRDSSRHSKDRKNDSKSSRDSKHDKKSSSKDDKNKSKERERSKDRKGNRDSSKNRSHKSSSKDSKSHRSSGSSHRKDDKKSSRDKDSRSSKDKSREKSSSKDKDRKSSKDKDKEKDKKKEKKDVDDHYSLSGRGNHGRRSTDRDSNDGSSSSKGNHQNNSKTESKKEKSATTKSDNTSISGDSTSPSDKEVVLDNAKMSQCKPVVRVDNLEVPIANPPRLPFVPDVTLKKPKFAANLEEAKKLMKMRKFLDEEQKRMNQEAALLLEFQANVRPSLSQVYSSIPGPELEFACVTVPQETCFEPTEPVKEQIAIKMDEDILNDDQNIIVAEQSIIEDDNTSQDSEIVMKEDEIVKEDDEDEEIKNILKKNENVDVSKNNEVKVEINEEIVEQNPIDSKVIEDIDEKDSKATYDENKPFSELMDEIKEYSKASESKKDDIDQNIDKKEVIELDIDKETRLRIEKEELLKQLENDVDECSEIDEKSQINEKELNKDNDNEFNENISNKYFEVTIITEELSDSEELKEDDTEIKEEMKQDKTENNNKVENIQLPTSESEFQYFAEHEKYNAELKRHEYDAFLKNYIQNLPQTKKMYLINCDSYEERIVRETAKNFGEYDIINYYKNGYVKLPTAKNVVNVKLSEEITLPIEQPVKKVEPMFSPVKSDCSFELCSEFDSKLDDINKKSRQEVMEIILGNMVDASPSKMPKIDYYSEDGGSGNILKRPIEVQSSVNNNRTVLTPNKIRRLSESDQISSTTEENEESSNNNKMTTTRSKYLGRARRVGLPKPKRCNLSNSPSSDKSVENYAQNSPLPTPNGKMKSTLRTKVQRYDTSDLYKPKLHYLSRRNHIT